jgi:hypothetical protein
LNTYKNFLKTENANLIGRHCIMLESLQVSKCWQH